jgi:Leucine-rich repeat (LRR) protein
MDEDSEVPDQELESETKVEEIEVKADFEALKVSATSVPLFAAMISKHLSLIARTVEGLSHSYIRLELHEKEITNLNDLEKFPHLRYIDVSGNQIISIEDLKFLPYLLSINLSKNFISEIPTILEKKQYLQHVNLSSNRLKEFMISSLPHLTFLNLNGYFD